MSGVPVTLLDAVTTGTSDCIAIPPSFKHHNIMITAAAGVTSGAVQPECSNSASDANVWAPIGGGPVTVIAGTDISVTFEGVFNFIRARVSTTIAGGTIAAATVVYCGAKSY